MKLMCRYHLVVRISRCGRENLGSTPSTDIFFDLFSSLHLSINSFEINIFSFKTSKIPHNPSNH
jgi:hypothetical protein